MLTDGRRVIALLVLPLCLFVRPSDAAAQCAAPGPPTMNHEAAASAPVSSSPCALQRLSPMVEDLTHWGQPAQQRAPRDSLKNGALIGAVVGAVALGAFGAVVCKVEQEPGGPSCLSDALRIGAIGAAIGAGAGLAIDAALTRNGAVAVGVRIKF